MFVFTKQQIETWNNITQATIDAGGMGLDKDFLEAMLIPDADSVKWEIEKPLTQEEVDKLYLENCPNKNCAVCVYLRGM